MKFTNYYRKILVESLYSYYIVLDQETRGHFRNVQNHAAYYPCCQLPGYAKRA